jgi:hypothetical protein
MPRIGTQSGGVAQHTPPNVITLRHLALASRDHMVVTRPHGND